MEEVAVRPDWTPGWGMSEEAAQTLWERAATRILEAEDRTGQTPRVNTIYRELHSEYPELYPQTNLPHSLYGWATDEAWLAYLAVRRQEHIIRTMAPRMQVAKYHARLLDKAGSELVRRLYEDTESFSKKDLLDIIKMSTGAMAMLEGDLNKAGGQETGAAVTINAFTFIDKFPADRKHILLAALARQTISPLLPDVVIDVEPEDEESSND